MAVSKDMFDAKPQPVTTLQQAARAFLDAYNAFGDMLEHLPETDYHKQQWDNLDWHWSCAAGPFTVARSIALDLVNAQYDWVVTYCDKKDRSKILGTRKLAALTGKQASDMAHKLSNDHGWNLKRDIRISPVPVGAEHLAKEDTDVAS